MRTGKLRCTGVEVKGEGQSGASRDSGLGPSYVDFDSRLTWHHKVYESSDLIFAAEGFNIANHTNFASVNNEVGPFSGFQPGFTNVNVSGIRPGIAGGAGTVTPSTPLAFTSAFPKRQIPLGVRLTF